jgi:uncharacterized phage protein gp47/JayE
MSTLTIPTLSQKLAFIRRQVQNLNKGISTVPGSGGSDLFTTPLAIVDVSLEAQAFFLNVSESITELLALETDTNTLELMAAAYSLSVSDIIANISQTLDKFGSNYSNPRKQPEQAQGNVQFGRPDPPDQDYTVNAGTIVTASNGQQYATTANVTMFQANSAQYFDSDLLLYLLTAPVLAVLAGSAGNVPASTMNGVVTPVNGFPYVTNTGDISEGLDLESDADYGARLLLTFQSIGIVTQAGIRASVLNNSAVTDLYLAKSGDPLATRGPGKADVYINGQVLSSNTESFAGYNSPLYGGCILPSKLPLLALVSTDSGTGFLQKDNFSVVAGSSQAQDVIRFSTPPTFPVSVTYEYDAGVASIQSIYDTDANAPQNQQPVVDLASAMNTAILVKACLELDIDYSATIQVEPGYLKSSVVAAVQNNIVSYGQTLELGQAVFVDDINKIVNATPGVLRIQGEPTKFSPSNQSGVSLVPIQPAANQLAVFLNVNIF